METENKSEKEKTNAVIKIDDTVNELFLQDEVRLQTPVVMSFVPSFFATASLPFKNVHKQVFTRKGANGLSLTLTSPINVPFGKYGRLLLSILTTHAVVSKEKAVPVYIEYALSLIHI